MTMAMETAMDANTISEEEWDDYPEMALLARIPLPSPLVCVYVDMEEEAIRHVAVQGDSRHFQSVGEGGGMTKMGAGGTVQRQGQAAA